MAVATANQAYFNGMNESDLDTKSGIVLDNTAKSTIAAKVDPEFKDAMEKRADYLKKVGPAKTGNREAIAEKNKAKADYKESLEFLIIAINQGAKGNVAILTGIGVPLNKLGAKNPPVKLEKPAGLTAGNQAVSGSVLLDVKTAVGARSFIFQYSLVPPVKETDWENEPSTAKSIVISGLSARTLVYFRVIAVGSRKQRIPSDVITLSIM